MADGVASELKWSGLKEVQHADWGGRGYFSVVYSSAFTPSVYCFYRFAHYEETPYGDVIFIEDNEKVEVDFIRVDASMPVSEAMRLGKARCVQWLEEHNWEAPYPTGVAR